MKADGEGAGKCGCDDYSEDYDNETLMQLSYLECLPQSDLIISHVIITAQDFVISFLKNVQHIVLKL